MTIKRIQSYSFKIMGQDNGCAVIAVVIVKCETVDDAIEGCHDFCTGRPPDIGAQMKAARFFSRVLLPCFPLVGINAKMPAPGIEGPVFIITTYPEPAVMGL